MKVLVVVCLIASVSALPRSFLGSEKCTWGPAYWCKTYKQATECNAIEHCKTHVWKSNDICSKCKTVAGQLHDYCKNNASAVMKLMKNLCAELEQYATECKTVVALYGETIINMVVQLTADSEKFCQGLELCPKTKQDVTHWIMKVFLKQLVSNPTIMNVKSLKEDYCEDCKLVIGEIKDVLMNKEIQSDIIAALESLCAELGPFGAECKNLVDQYGPLVFDLLAGYMDPGTICSDLGLCNSSKNIVPAVPLKLAAVPLKPAPVKTLLSAAPIPVLILAKEVKKAKPAKSPKASLQCTLCEFVMKELDGLLKDQETEDGIEQALDKVCSLLPPTIQSDCEDFVKEFSPEIIDFLVNELQPDKVCAALGLCNGKKNLIRVSLHKDVKVKDETCELCKLAVQYLENVLKTNATEEEIKKALEQLCSSLPPQLSTECNQIVQEYGDLIIKLILGDITPEEVCQALNLCTAVKKSYVKNKCYLGESYWCANYFNALKCENEIFQEIMRVCSHLPSSLSSKCFLAAREFRKDKENEIEDRSLCEVLKFFKNAESQVVSKKGVKNSSVCDDCKYGVKFIGNLFPKNTTKKEILDGLKAVCSRFQPVVSKVCNDLVNRYSELIVKLLLGEVDPEKFCEQLKLCKPSKKARTNWKCYLGESFWCSSYQNALDCQALEHCKINV